MLTGSCTGGLGRLAILLVRLLRRPCPLLHELEGIAPAHAGVLLQQHRLHLGLVALAADTPRRAAVLGTAFAGATKELGGRHCVGV